MKSRQLIKNLYTKSPCALSWLIGSVFTLICFIASIAVIKTVENIQQSRNIEYAHKISSLTHNEIVDELKNICSNNHQCDDENITEEIAYKVGLLTTASLKIIAPTFGMVGLEMATEFYNELPHWNSSDLAYKYWRGVAGSDLSGWDIVSCVFLLVKNQTLERGRDNIEDVKQFELDVLQNCKGFDWQSYESLGVVNNTKSTDATIIGFEKIFQANNWESLSPDMMVDEDHTLCPAIVETLKRFAEKHNTDKEVLLTLLKIAQSREEDCEKEDMRMIDDIIITALLKLNPTYDELTGSWSCFVNNESRIVRYLLSQKPKYGLIIGLWRIIRERDNITMLLEHMLYEQLIDTIEKKITIYQWHIQDSPWDIKDVLLSTQLAHDIFAYYSKNINEFLIMIGQLSRESYDSFITDVLPLMNFQLQDYALLVQSLRENSGNPDVMEKKVIMTKIIPQIQYEDPKVVADIVGELSDVGRDMVIVAQQQIANNKKK